jgi:alanyl aminopeptidase
LPAEVDFVDLARKDAAGRAPTIDDRDTPRAMSLRLSAALLTLTAAGCGGSSAPPARPTDPVAAPAAAVAAPTPPDLRLPAGVRPVRYQATLELDPAAQDFGGVIAIDVSVDAATDLFWLNADGLTIESAEIEAAGARTPLVAWTAPRDFLALRAPAPIAAGSARLHLRYRGRIRPDEKGGMALFADGGERYLVTHFEPDDARRVFPSFDEPGHKVPWQLTLRVPAANEALTNTEVVSSTVDGGWKVVTFAPTRPLPSYLICIAVGPFEAVPAGTMKTGHPIRIVTPKGRTAGAAFAASAVGELQALLEAYTGIPYPYGKMDHIAYPGPGGAMEHVGLITYGETALLMPAVEQSARREYGIASIATHELAHQWFGNLVTPAWWDDIWLNESFASWADNRFLRAWRPGWGVDQAEAWERHYALGSDSVSSARKIHQPVASRHDVVNAFDNITYGKGAAVLGMIEHWLGEDVFQKVVRTHLGRHRDATATYADFAKTLGEIAGPDAPGVLASFVDQAGAPRLEVALRCERGTAPALTVAQSRFTPLGAAALEGRWDMPVCVRWSQRGKAGKTCRLVKAATEVIPLEGATGCPDWVLPNAGGRGYYRTVPRGDLLLRLTRHLAALDDRERIALAGDAEALVEAGELAVGAALDLAAALATRSDRASVTAAIMLAYAVDDHVAAADRPAWQAWVRRHLGAPARALGLTPRPRDSRDQRMLRASLVKLVGTAGADATIAAEARTLAVRWIADPAAIDGELVDSVLGVAAANGDRALWDALVEATRATSSMRTRSRLLGVLAQFRDPALVEATLALALDPGLPAHETISLVGRVGGWAESAPLAYRFLRANWDALVARLPADAGAGLVWVGARTCDPALRADVAAFFDGRSTVRKGGPRTYAQALEAMDSCVAWKRANGPALSAYLAK